MLRLIFSALLKSPPITETLNLSATDLIPFARSVTVWELLTSVIAAATSKYFGVDPMAKRSAKFAVVNFAPIWKGVDHSLLKWISSTAMSTVATNLLLLAAITAPSSPIPTSTPFSNEV